MSEKSRIAKNTFLLYLRTLFTLFVSLYTSRIILAALGVTDYGVYTVVGGVASMFGILNGSLTTATQRFLTFELGKKEGRRLREVFSTTITIHCLLALLVLLLAETIGSWFLNSYMNIPPERMEAANWVFQCSIFTFILNLVSVPYNASIIAHERMSAFAYISIIEVSLKLSVALLLQWFMYDKLIVYAILMLLTAVIIRFIYSFYCKRNFSECRFRFFWDKQMYREITGFAGWNLMGSSSYLLMTQGVSIVVNLFFGVVVNAARGIAVQVEAAANSFVSGFMTALNPQITKNYAAGNYSYMMVLIQKGGRYSYYLFLFLSIPMIIEAETVLRLWLGVVPDYTLAFVRLTLIYTLFQTLSNTLITGVLATGRIKKYQLIVGGIQLLNFPLSYLFLYLGFSPEITYVISIILQINCFLFRIYLLHRMIHFSIPDYMKQVVLNVLMVTVFSSLPPLLVYFNMPSGIFRLLSVIMISSCAIIASLYFYGFSVNERSFFVGKIKSVFHK